MPIVKIQDFATRQLVRHLYIKHYKSLHTIYCIGFQKSRMLDKRLHSLASMLIFRQALLILDTFILTKIYSMTPKVSVCCRDSYWMFTSSRDIRLSGLSATWFHSAIDLHEKYQKCSGLIRFWARNTGCLILLHTP